MKTRISGLLLLCALVASMTGCSNLPGSKGQQGAVIGGASGAVAGAVIGGSSHRLLGVLLGGALGAGGGYLIGANVDKITGRDQQSATQANQKAQTQPATAADVARSTTADLNADGFVTMDEIVAMKSSGLSDQQILQRMQTTGQVFELTPEQRQYLLSHGVDQYVVNQIPNLNRAQRDQLLNQQSSVISQPAAPAPY